MDRVEPAAGLVLELPDLDVAGPRVGERAAEVAVDHVVPGLAVDRPAARSCVRTRACAVATASDSVRPMTGVRIQRRRASRCSARSVGPSPTTSKRMTLSRVGEVDVVLRARGSSASPAARRELREVDDDLVALGHAEPEARARPAASASGRRPWRSPSSGVAVVERDELVRARERRVEDAEAVLAALRPSSRGHGHAVHQDHVAHTGSTRCCRRSAAPSAPNIASRTMSGHVELARAAAAARARAASCRWYCAARPM